MNQSTRVYCNVPNDQIPEKEWKEIQSSLYPGESSQVGFLKPGEKLSDVITKDNLFLQNTGITHEQIADRMLTIEHKYRSVPEKQYNESTHRNYAVIENGKFHVEIFQTKGFQDCPFQNTTLDPLSHHDYGSADLFVTNLTTGKSIMFGTLQHHLIRCHQFFEGSTQYRLEPSDVIDVLEIKPNVSYTPKFITKYELGFGSGSSRIRPELCNPMLFEALGYYSAGYKFFQTDNNVVVVIVLPCTRYFGFDTFSDNQVISSEIDIIIDSYNKKLPYVEMRKRLYDYHQSNNDDDGHFLWCKYEFGGVDRKIQNEVDAMDDFKNGIYRKEIDIMIMNFGDRVKVQLDFPMIKIEKDVSTGYYFHDIRQTKILEDN
jgi:hypothetical protein